MLLAGIYNFAYINDKEELTRMKYVIFHSICYFENLVMVIIWAVFGSHSVWYYIPGIVLPLVCYILGLIVMSIYYAFLHPSKLPLYKEKKREGGAIVDVL